MIDEEDRRAFIAGADEALSSGRYPKLQLSVYFDSQDDNSGQNCLIGNRTWRMGGDATCEPRAPAALALASPCNGVAPLS